MKIKPIAILASLLGLLAAGLLAGKALIEKAKPLPPTGGLPAASIPSAPSPQPFWESIATKDLEIALEDRDDAADILQFLRHREERRAAQSAPGVSSVPLPSPTPVRAEPVEARTVPSTHYFPLTTHSLPEPTIREVHLAAIKYAEVRPEKIQHWRKLAQLRNFVPHFTLGLDRDRNTTIGSSSSNGKTNFTVGPEDKSVSVDFGFTWDLANLVWDSAQTSIDVRSRLMVQLRQDILEETTRIYFERQRLMNEFEAAPVNDPILKKERSLRLAELTAQLDALTGGLYSEGQ